MIRPKHILTERSFLRAGALEAARKAYGAFASNLDTSERLAKLSLACVGVPGPQLTARDISKLHSNEFLSRDYGDPNRSLTLKGVIAVNLVGVDVYDGNEIDFYLREPFAEIDILGTIHSGVKKSSSILF
jgi:hypothetical protein